MANCVTPVIIVIAGARPVAVESCAMVVDYRRKGITNVSEDIKACPLANRETAFLRCLRFYFNEPYTEPPPEALPPPPPPVSPPVALFEPPTCTVS